MSGTIENCNGYFNAHTFNDESASLKSMSIWIKKARVFRKH